MTSRSKRLRRSNKFDDFAYEEIEEMEPPIDGLSGSSSPATRKSKRAVPLLHDIKKEPDDTCVLPTDSVIDIAVRTRKRSSCTKAQLKAMMNQDKIPFDLLLTFSSVMLRELFSEMESDELSRQFVVKCQLMPASCATACKSFGNERRAQAAMERHLMDHVNQLNLDSASDFVAESVQARERRIKREALEARIKMESPKVLLERLPMLEGPPPKKTRKRRKKRRELVSNAVAPEEEYQQSKLKLRISYGNGSRKGTVQVKEEVNSVNRESSASEIEIEDFEDPSPLLDDTNTRSTMLLETETMISKQKEMIERVRSQLRLEKQPYKDHCYPVLVKGQYRNDLLPEEEEETTTVKPKIYSINNKSEWCQSSDSEEDDVIQHDLACHYCITGAKRKTGFVVAKGDTQVPIMQLLQIPKRLMSAPAVGEEVVISKCKPKTLNPVLPASNGCIVESDTDDEGPSITTLARPYPPMPKYMPELGTKLVIPEEEMAFEDNEEVPEQWDLKNPDHVKRYAVRCMRDLKVNKGLGARNCNVSCKICNKEFTATATLMYHYRSHAEIKPFCCLLCKATFTRQHSLNYHMLIHNDANRFKCPDCGRAFRHPSHYKEHRRKHTGEQPYQCPECKMKFKTRNSFKRHLSAKHPDLDVKEIDKAKKLRLRAEQKRAMAEANRRNSSSHKFVIKSPGLNIQPKTSVITSLPTNPQQPAVYALSAASLTTSTSTTSSNVASSSPSSSTSTLTSTPIPVKVSSALIGSNGRPVLVVKGLSGSNQGMKGSNVGFKAGIPIKMIKNITCQPPVSSVSSPPTTAVSKIAIPKLSLPGITTLNSSPRFTATFSTGSSLPRCAAPITIVQAPKGSGPLQPINTSSAMAFLQKQNGTKVPLTTKPQVIVLARPTTSQALSFPKLVAPVVSQESTSTTNKLQVVNASKPSSVGSVGQPVTVGKSINTTVAGQSVTVVAVGQLLTTAAMDQPVTVAAVSSARACTTVTSTPSKQLTSDFVTNIPSTVLDTGDDDDDTSLLCLDATDID